MTLFHEMRTSNGTAWRHDIDSLFKGQPVAFTSLANGFPDSSYWKAKGALLLRTRSEIELLPTVGGATHKGPVRESDMAARKRD